MSAPSSSSLRSSLAKARGLGSAGTGTAMFQLSRLTWLATMVVTTFVLIVLIVNAGSGYMAMKTALSGFFPTLGLTLFVAVTFFHFTLEMQEVIEDYVHNHGLARGLMLAIRFSFAVLAVASLLMILRNFFGG